MGSTDFERFRPGCGCVAWGVFTPDGGRGHF